VITDYFMQILQTASAGTIGAGSGWRIGAGRMLDQPDTQICVYDSPGQTPSPLWLLDYPFVQLMVRGAPDQYSVARQKAQDCYDILLGLEPISFENGDNIDAITIIGTPSFIGSDQKNRPMISTNYRVIFEPATNALTRRLPLGA
jgi:Bacteriophage minor capsid protein